MTHLPLLLLLWLGVPRGDAEQGRDAVQEGAEDAGPAGGDLRKVKRKVLIRYM